MIRTIFAIIFICQFLFVFSTSCQQGDKNTESDNEDIENQDEDVHQSDISFDRLDEKMNEIMEESQQENENEVQEVKLVKAEGATDVKVKLSIGAGKLRLTGASSELMLAGFIYSNAKWKPQVDYRLNGKTGLLTVKQPDMKDAETSNNNKYVWNLKFNNQMPLDFDVELGAGLSEIKLGGLNINNFSMEMGVGKTEIDLRGEWERNSTINLTGGIGHCKINLPQNVGVKLYIDKGIGSLDFSGLTQKDKNLYVNKLAEGSGIVLTINIRTGIGKIEVE
jgi:predicted membrane protein